MNITKQFLKRCLTISVLLGNIALFSQNTSFEIVLQNDSVYLEPTTFIRSNDNGFIGIIKRASLIDSVNYISTDIFKISNEGDTNSIGFVKEDTLYAYYNIIRVDDSIPGYLLSGVGYNINEDPEYKFYVFTRLDNEMNKLWEKVYSFDFRVRMWRSDILQLKDSSFLFASSQWGSTEMFLFKLSDKGDSLDYKEYSGDDAGEVMSLTYNCDSTCYLLHTEWAHYYANTSTCSMITISEDLEQLAYRFYPDFYGTPYNSLLLPSGEIITGGSEFVNYPPGTWEKYISAYKLDSQLNPISEIQCTNPDTNSRGAETVALDFYYPSCIYLGGNHNLQGFSGNDPSWFYVTKLNENLEIQYEKYIGGDYYYWLYSVAAANDGGVLLSGFTLELGAPSYMKDGYFIKLDSTGCITNIPENSNLQIKEVLVYPNPGVNEMYIRTALNDCSVSLFDIRGNCLVCHNIKNHISRIDVDDLQPGIYTYLIEKENTVIETGKWIKQ